MLVMPEHTNIPCRCLLSHIVSLPCINPLIAVDSRCCLTLDTLRHFMSVPLFSVRLDTQIQRSCCFWTPSPFIRSHTARVFFLPPASAMFHTPHIFPHPHDIYDRSCDMGISKRFFFFWRREGWKVPPVLSFVYLRCRSLTGGRSFLHLTY